MFVRRSLTAAAAVVNIDFLTFFNSLVFVAAVVVVLVAPT